MEALPDIDVSQNRIADAEQAKIACCITKKTHVVAYLKSKSMIFVEPIIERLRYDYRTYASS